MWPKQNSLKGPRATYHVVRSRTYFDINSSSLVLKTRLNGSLLMLMQMTLLLTSRWLGTDTVLA